MTILTMADMIRAVSIKLIKEESKEKPVNRCMSSPRFFLTPSIMLAATKGAIQALLIKGKRKKSSQGLVDLGNVVGIGEAVVRYENSILTNKLIHPMQMIMIKIDILEPDNRSHASMRISTDRIFFVVLVIMGSYCVRLSIRHMVRVFVERVNESVADEGLWVYLRSRLVLCY